MRRTFADFGSRTPAALRNLYRLLPDAVLDERTDPRRFSPREVLCHLVDCEAYFLGCVEAAVRQPGSPTPLFDLDGASLQNRYSEQDIRTQLERFSEERLKSIQFINELAPEEFKLESVCRWRGPVSITEHCGFWLGHDLYHLEQLSAVAVLQPAAS